MDFMQRSGRPTQTSQANGSDNQGSHQDRVGSSKKNEARSLSVFSAALLFSLAVLLVAVVSVVVVTKPRNEGRLVATDKVQAVFLNGGQVYFGRIRTVTNSYVTLQDIFYFPATEDNKQNASDRTLVKLGCEIHGPQDQMVINRDQILFWENLKNDGKVAKVIDEYRKQYPNGQQCSDQQTQPNQQTETNQSTNTNNSNNSR